MRISNWVCIILLMPTLCFAGETLTLSLQEAIELGLKHNRTLKISQERVRASEYGVKSARTAFFPQLTGGGTYTHLDQRPFINASGFGRMFEPLMAPFQNLVDNGYLDPATLEGLSGGGADRIYVGQADNYLFSLSVQQPLFTGGALRNSYQIAQRDAEVQSWNLERDERQLQLDVTEAFLSLVKALGFLEVTEESIRQLEAHIQDLENLYAEGMIIENDLLKAQVQLSSVRLLNNRADNGVQMAVSYLCYLLDLDLGTEIVPAEIPEASEGNLNSLSSYISYALRKRPELKAIEAQKEMGKSLVSLQRSKYFPSLFLVGNYDWKRPNRQYEPEFYGSWNVLLTMQLDLFNWGETHYRIEEAQSAYRQVAEASKLLENGVALEVKQAYLTLLEDRRAVELAEEALNQAGENYRVTRENFHAGVATNTDLLDAQAELTKAKTEKVNAHADVLIAQEKFKLATAGYK
jgi:outer membrane protein